MSDNKTTVIDQKSEASPNPVEPERKAVEVWEAERDVEGWLRVAARTLHRWPRGRELTAEEFDAGIERVRALVLG